MKHQIIRRYAIDLPVYNVVDSDSGEVLSVGIPMKEVVRRHGAIIEHLHLERAKERAY